MIKNTLDLRTIVTLTEAAQRVWPDAHDNGKIVIEYDLRMTQRSNSPRYDKWTFQRVNTTCIDLSKLVLKSPIVTYGVLTALMIALCNQLPDSNLFGNTEIGGHIVKSATTDYAHKSCTPFNTY